MYYSIPMPWVLFLPFCLLPVRKNWSACLAYIVFFIAAYFVFYSIRPVLWGVPRYQSELWLPFMILGFYNLIILLGQIKSAELPIRIGLVLLIASNAIVITHLDRINRPVDRWTDYYDEVKTGNVRILSEGVYNIDVAMQAVRDGGYAKSACKVGITYGTFSEVMRGYSFEEMESARSNFLPCSSWGPLDISAINSNKNINLLLFIDKPNKDNEIKQLLDSGRWVVWKEFHNGKYGSTIIGIARKK